MLKIGDKIRVTNPFDSTIYEIFRVTKNKAAGRSKDGYEKSFYKDGWIRKYPQERYDMNHYELVK